MGSGLTLAICLALAYFIVKGFLSWLADVSIWALQALESGKSLAPSDQGFVHPVPRAPEVSQELETRQPYLAPGKIGSAQSHAGSLGVLNEPKITGPDTGGTRSGDRLKLLDAATGRSAVAPLIGPETGYENHCDYTLAHLNGECAGKRRKWYFVTKIIKLLYSIFGTRTSHKL